MITNILPYVKQKLYTAIQRWYHESWKGMWGEHMSLDKAIEHHKEHRKPYVDERAMDVHCRNNGSCDYCRRNRLYQLKKELEKCNSKLKEWESGTNGPMETKGN